MEDREPPFTIGIEEEYLLIDPATGELATDPPETILKECERLLGKRVTPELLRAQIEVGTKACGSIAEVADDLVRLRRCIRDVAGEHGLAFIAASTHPTALWDQQKRTDRERYDTLIEDMQTPARRLLISGMHVHVGIGDDDMRIDLMNQVAYFLPHLLALSTSSPFWHGQKTGLMSYRMAVWRELPRTGLPPQFQSFSEYRRTAETLIQSGVIEDTTKIWWDVRPSDRFPTLEMRMTDICTRVEDTICIAALYRCLLRMLWRLRQDNQSWRRYDRFMVAENCWRAQRYGFDQGLIDFGKRKIVPYPDLLEEILRHIREDAEFFDSVAEVEHARSILQRGTSAHRQIAVWQEAKNAGKDDATALREVIAMLAEDSVHGL
ncbi:MAG: carboxylate-amine ligase [Geminicoccaceae bacterium]